MNKFFNYLLMRAEEPSLPQSGGNFRIQEGGTAVLTEDANLSNRRVVISIVGILLGIFLSFVITGLQKIETTGTGTEQTQSSDQLDSAITNDRGIEGISVRWPDKGEIWVMALITFVICLLSYPGLYAALRVHHKEPAILILCISFQYGFFWQSLVKGATTIL